MTAEPAIVTGDDWLRARVKLLAAEKALTRRRDEVTLQRQALPWVRVERDYRFDTAEGPRTLRELFAGRSQLMIYHFMFGAGWAEGCPSCSFWADNFDGVDVHLGHRDTTFLAASRAPVDKLQAYRRRMGWRFGWVSTAGSEFNVDFGVSDASTYNYVPVAEPAEESPGLSVFALRDDTVFHTYSAYSRGLDAFNAAYQLLDLTPKGRDEAALPWTMAWLHRHDAYPD